MKPIKLVVLLFAFACSKTEKTDAPSAAPAEPATPPATATPPAPTPTPAPPPSGAGSTTEGSAAAAMKQPLSAYLDKAVAAKLFETKLDPGGGGLKKTEQKQLDEKATKDYLAAIGLAQRADGPLVKCPPDAQLELFDASGTLLGTIGFCRDHARFDAPDGTMGGIKATRP